jgi:hypothetical protein
LLLKELEASEAMGRDFAFNVQGVCTDTHLELDSLMGISTVPQGCKKELLASLAWTTPHGVPHWVPHRAAHGAGPRVCARAAGVA